jgi:hypothetical protein
MTSNTRTIGIGWKLLALAIILASVGGAACTPAGSPVQKTRKQRFEDHIPPNSTGRKPAGTRDDPYVGIGVVFGMKDVSAQLVRVGVRHRPISYFKKAADMAVNLPRHIVADVREGDLVKLYYARMDENSPVAIAYRQVLKGQEPKDPGPYPYVYFGYEVFRLEVIPDNPAGGPARQTKEPQQ